jgi:hypothetical protein
MSGTGRSNLSLQGRGPDVNWFKTPINHFAPRAWGTGINHIVEFFDLSPTNNAATYAYGNMITFEVDKRVDQWGKAELIMTRAADTSSATALAFNDYEAHSSVDYVDYKYNNKIFHRSYGEELLKDLLQERDSIEREVQAKLAYGNLTQAQREAQALVENNLGFGLTSSLGSP